jgi:hypothetical protein
MKTAMPRAALVRLCAILFLAMGSAGCQLAAGIFRAGFWVGIIVAVVIVIVFARLFRRS